MATMKTTFDEYVLLTGGHTGLGLGVTEKILLEHPNTKIGLVIRSESRKSQTIDDFKNGLGVNVEDRIDFFYADLSDQAQVRSAALAVVARWTQVDKLFCNAGIVPAEYKESASGNEIGLEINALAHVILTQELTPLLEKVAGSVIVTTTDGMNGRKLDVSVFEDKTRKGLFGYYPQAKQAAMLLLFDVVSDGVKVRAVNPGPNKSKLTMGNSDLPWYFRLLGPLIFKDPSVGTGRIYRAAYEHSDETKAWFDYDKKVILRATIAQSEKAALLAKIIK